MVKRDFKAFAPWTDSSGQLWMLKPDVARKAQISVLKLNYAEKKQWIQGRKKRGRLWYPWPQVIEQLKQNSTNPPDDIPITDISPPTPDKPENPYDLPEVLTRRQDGPGRPPGITASANATKTKIAAELLRLEYESKLGRLVPYEEVRRVWENAAETLKKSLLSIPDRIAPEFGGKNSHRLYRALVTEINHVLENMKIKHDYGRLQEQRRVGRPLGR